MKNKRYIHLIYTEQKCRLFLGFRGKNEEKSALIFGKVSVKNRRDKVETPGFPCSRGKKRNFEVQFQLFESPTPHLKSCLPNSETAVCPYYPVEIQPVIGLFIILSGQSFHCGYISSSAQTKSNANEMLAT